MRRSAILALALALSTSTATCANAPDQVEKIFYAEALVLSFDRPSDLIPPEGLRVTSTEERQIALAWEPVLVGDVKGYAIKRARGPQGEHFLVGQTGSRFSTVFIDSGGPEGLGDGQTYSYRVHPFDSLGRVSRSHSHISATTEPRPSIPDGLRSYSNLPRKVALAWDPNDARSVVGYGIYRSPTPSGQWTQVGFARGRLNTVWEDPVNGDLRQMYYRIEAINRFGAASDPSAAVRAVTKAEPLPPIQLGVAGTRLGEIDLSWAANVERDLVRYEIWRSDGPQSELPTGDADQAPELASYGGERKVGQVESQLLGFTDEGIGCHQWVRYRMRAVDRDRLISAFSEPLVAQGGDMGLRLESRGSGAPKVTWDAELLGRWPGARISEGRTALPDRQLGTVTGVASYGLTGLPAGSHEIRVTLLGPRAEGGANPVESPTCALRVEIPAGGANTP